MQPQRYERIEELFHLALEQGMDRLAAACADDKTLLDEVTELVQSHHECSAAQPPEPEPPLPQFGAYQCDRIVGVGGMGTVYAAHRVDGQFVQNVAIKILRTSLRSEWFRRQF